jgi:hypothetical protein
MNWEIPRIWEGADCYIIGGGSSVPRQFGVPDNIIQDVFTGRKAPSAYSPYMKQIQDKHIIAVNMAYKLGDWVDILFFGDSGFWKKWKEDILTFEGLKITCSDNLEDPAGHVKRIRKNRGKDLGITFNQKAVSWNYNSGGAAINLAVNFGVKRIILLGFDMQLDSENNQHWHKFYKGNAKTVRATLVKHLRGFPKMAVDLKDRVEIINCSPDSLIDCFPKMNINDVI